MTKTRTRFAPSPTGYLHIGGLRTALFAYLTARSAGGELILRIEDTDQKRYVEGAVEKLLDILKWAGLEFDEGPHTGGDYGPYVQSERMRIYEKYAKELVEKGEAYYCFCSAERLDQRRQEQQAAKQAPRYDRTCRNISRDDARAKLDRGEKYVIRQKMPLEGEVAVQDELRGDIKFAAGELEDQILVKSDGMPTYQFASVVDDHLMQISHVVRGEEWIPSLPKNVLLYRSFGWEEPVFVHLPLILNKEGGKLSKRHGDVSVENYQEKGYLPEVLVNFCVLLGWHPKEDREIYRMDELKDIFKFSDIGTSPAVFDTGKLDYFNGYYIRQKPVSELVGLSLPYLEKDGLVEKNEQGAYISVATGCELSKEYLEGVVSLEQERMKVLSEVSELTGFFFVDIPEYEPDLLVWKKMTKEQAAENISTVLGWAQELPEKEWTEQAIEKHIVQKMKANEFKVGEYLWPMRVALTGRKASPGPFEVASVLGKTDTLKRLDAARKKAA